MYQLDIIGAPHPGVNFLPVGAALQPGDSEIFEFRVVASTLHAGEVLWNIGTTTGNETGVIYLREELCFELPVPRLGPSPRASAMTQLLIALVISALLAARLFRRRSSSKREG